MLDMLFFCGCVCPHVMNPFSSLFSDTASFAAGQNLRSHLDLFPIAPRDYIGCKEPLLRQLDRKREDLERSAQVCAKDFLTASQVRSDVMHLDVYNQQIPMCCYTASVECTSCPVHF